MPSLEDLTIDGVTYHDVVIEITYGHAIGKWDVTQLINNEDGTTSAADENFKLTFTGTARTVTAKRDGEPEQQRPFYESTSPDSPVVLTNNASTGKATLGIFRGTSNVSFTASAPEGYRVSYIDYRVGNSSDNYANSRMTRNGDTFTITNLPALNDSGNTLNRRITVYYSKSASVEVHQETDGEVIAGSSSKIGTVTLSTQNSGSYISSIATVMMNRSMASVFTENAGENSYDEQMYSSVGNKPTVTVQVGAASRVIQSVTLSVKRNGVVTELVKDTDYTETTHTFSKAEYKLNCMLGLNDTLYVNVRYASATRINVRILEKKTTDDSTLIPMSAEAGAVVTVTGTGAVTGEGANGYQFMNYPNGNQKVNSFTVSDGNPVNYTTQGSTKLTIHVELPENSPYVVANVDACKMVNDAPGASLGDVVVPASNQEITGYGNCRDYSTSSFNMTGTNVCLRVILAKTADVTVSFRSRGGNTDSLFADNTVSNAYMSMTHSNQCYGGAVFPVIINNGTNTFNTDSYTVGLDPSTRTVRSIDRSFVSGIISVPKGWLLASVTATCTDAENNVTDVSFSTGNYTYTGDANPSYQTRFTLGQALRSGCHYDIVVNIEQATEITLNVYHSTESGTYELNSKTNSKATLIGTRGSDTADAPYNQSAYRSTTPFSDKASGKPMTGSFSVSRNPSTATYYVLRNTDIAIAALPEASDSFVKAEAHIGSTVYDCTQTAVDDNRTVHLNVSQPTELGRTLVIDVYFADIKTTGRLNFEARDIYGNVIDLPEGANIHVNASHAIYSKPLCESDGNGNAGTDTASASITSLPDGRKSYIVVANSSVKTTFSSGANSRVYTYTVKQKKADGTESQQTYNAWTQSGDTRSFNFVMAKDSEVTVVITYLGRAYVEGRAFYSENAEENDWYYRFKDNDTSANSIRFTQIILDDVPSETDPGQTEEVEIHSDSMLVSGKNSKTVGAASHSLAELKITELAGYRFEKVVLKRDYDLDVTITRADILAQDETALPISWGNNVVTVPLPDEFRNLTAGKSYHVEAYFAANPIHLMAYACTEEQYAHIKGDSDGTLLTRIANYSSYHNPKNVASIIERKGATIVTPGYHPYSFEGAWSGRYFYENVNHLRDYDAAMSVRIGSQPGCFVSSQVDRQNNMYYCVGAVLYGTSQSYQNSQFDIMDWTPEKGKSYYFNMDKVQGEQYITVLYVMKKGEDTPTTEPNPTVPTSDGGVLSTTELKVFSYIHNEATDETPFFDGDFGTITVEQHCIGYYSSTRRHADDHEAEPFIHDDQPVLQQYNSDTKEWDTKVPALAKDYVQNDQGENVHPSATTYKADPITLSGGRSYYHVKTHTYDTTRVTMKFTPPENCIVKRIYIQDDNTGEGFDVKGDSYTYTPSSDTKLTVQVYFGRPSVEVNVNNYQQHKGSVQINDGSGATISTVSRDDDYAQATFFNANQDISVSIRPSEGYRFADAWVGTNASDAVLVSEGLDTASDFPNVTLSIPSRTENLFLRINFVSDNDPDTANLYVSKYVIDRSGNLQPFTDGAVDISGQNEISNPLITGNGECSSASLGQGQYTMGMSVITDTTLGFDVTLPADYILVSADSGYVQENAPTNLPFEVTYTESGETQRSEIKGSDLSNNGYYWTFDKSFVTNGRTIYVNVYYAPVYKLIYNANGGTGTVPATTGNHLSGSQAAIENNWNKLSREDSRFLGWSLTPDNDPNGVITDANVTFGSRDITLYAVWEAKEQYQVKYFGNCDDADDGHDDGTRLAVDTYYEGKTVTVRANVKDGNPFFVRTNYNFLGWARNQNATEPEYIPGQSGHDSFVINENTDLYAVWSENTRYTVLYRIVGDNQPDVTLDQYTGTYYGGTTLEKKNKAIDVSGYDFSGWSYDDAASDDADTFVTPEGNLVITGTFTPHTHNVTYAVTSNDNPTFNLPEPKNNVAYGSTVTGIADPLTPPEGFTFTGWNVRDPEDAMEIATDNGTTTSFKMPDHDVVLEGSFARQSYQLTYSVSGDIPSGYTAPGNETYAYNADVNVADKPEIAGYTFKGWTYEGTDYTGNAAFRMPAIAIQTNKKTSSARW